MDHLDTKRRAWIHTQWQGFLSMTSIFSFTFVQTSKWVRSKYEPVVLGWFHQSSPNNEVSMRELSRVHGTKTKCLLTLLPHFTGFHFSHSWNDKNFWRPFEVADGSNISWTEVLLCTGAKTMDANISLWKFCRKVFASRGWDILLAKIVGIVCPKWSQTLTGSGALQSVPWPIVDAKGVIMCHQIVGWAGGNVPKCGV